MGCCALQHRITTGVFANNVRSARSKSSESWKTKVPDPESYTSDVNISKLISLAMIVIIAIFGSLMLTAAYTTTSSLTVTLPRESINWESSPMAASRCVEQKLISTKYNSVKVGPLHTNSHDHSYHFVDSFPGLQLFVES